MLISLIVPLAFVFAALAGGEELSLDFAAALEPGATARYELTLDEGEFVRFAVVPEAAYIELRPFDPSGTELLHYAHNNLGTYESILGWNTRAAGSFDRAAQRFRDAGDDGGFPLVRLNLGVQREREGRTDEALALLEEAVAGLRAAGNRTAEASALNTMAVFGNLGDHAHARSCAEQALALRRQLGNKWAQSASQATLGSWLEEGDLARARTALKAALALARETQNNDAEAWAVYLLGRLEARAGEPAAVSSWQRSLELRHERGAVQEEAWLWAAIGEWHLDHAPASKAGEAIEKARVLFESVSGPHGAAQAASLRARLKLLGLTQAFFFASARGVLAAIWSVTDTASPDLMVPFYRRMAAGQPPAEALREAELVRGCRWPYPHHWAAYILMAR